MTAKARGVIELLFGDGTAIDTWETYQLRQNYTDPLGSFSFTTKPNRESRGIYRKKLAKGERVTITIEGQRQATAIITTLEEELGDDGYVMQIEAKSPLATAYEGGVDPYVAKTFAADTPIANVVLEVLQHYGFDSIITDATGDVTVISGKSLSGRADPVILSELKHKDVQASQGEAAYAFCARLFSRLGLLLRCDNEGKLLLGAPDYDQSAVYQLAQDRDQSHFGDRMLRRPPMRARSTNDGQFSEIIVIGKSADRRGQTSAGTPIAGIEIEGAVPRQAGVPFEDTKMRTISKGRHTYSSTVAPFKPKYRTDKKSRDVEWAQNFAEIMHGARASKAYQFTCAVDGLISVSGGRIWAVDTVGHIFSEDLDIDDDMWLLETVQSGSKGGGQLTQLTWIPLGSLVLGEAT